MLFLLFLLEKFVTNTVAVDVEPRVEKSTVASTSTDVVYDDDWYDQLFDDLHYRRLDKDVQNAAIKWADEFFRDICGVHKDVEYDFDFEECDSDGEGYKGDDVPDLMPTDWERLVMSQGRRNGKGTLVLFLFM